MYAHTHADRWVDPDSKRLNCCTSWLMPLLARNPHHIQIHSGSRNLNGSVGGCRSTSRLAEPWPAGGRAALWMASNIYHHACNQNWFFPHVDTSNFFQGRISYLDIGVFLCSTCPERCTPCPLYHSGGNPCRRLTYIEPQNWTFRVEPSRLRSLEQEKQEPDIALLKDKQAGDGAQ